jgi:hypothetical protein
MQAIGAQRTGLPVQRPGIFTFKRCRSLKLVVASTGANKDVDRDDDAVNSLKKSAGAMLGAMAAASLVGGFCMRVNFECLKVISFFLGAIDNVEGP